MGPLLFKRKPLIVEAMHFTGGEIIAQIIIRWVNENGGHAECILFDQQMPETLIIGHQFANVGDYIMKESAGSFRVIKPQVFEANHSKLT
jgi:hypothetical protein